MAHSPRTVRIGIASFVAVLMVGGAYAFSGPDPLFGLGRIAEAQSSEELLKEYAAKDSDTDGLPDWQESLYGTDPLDPESFKDGVKDGDAVAQGLVEPRVSVRAADEPTDIESIPGETVVPGTVTDRFAQSILTQYLRNRGDVAPSSAEIVSFVEAGIANLSAESVSPPTFTAGQVRTAAGGMDGMIAYAANVEAAFKANTVSSDRNELSYFSDALKDDAAALAKIEDISQAYADIANALMKVGAPAEARQAHLAIANALMHMSEINGDMAAMKNDPVRALMGIGLYSRYAEQLVAAFSNMHGVFSALQIQIPEGEAGYGLLKTASQASESTPL